MDRNQLIGILLMVALFWAYFQFFAPDPIEPPAEEPVVEQTPETPREEITPEAAPVLAEDTEADLGTLDSLEDVRAVEQFGIFAPFSSGDKQTFDIENEDVVFTFSTQGGHIERVLLKNYKSFNGDPLVLNDENTSEIARLLSSQGRIINLDELYYSTNTTATVLEANDTITVQFTLALNDQQKLAQTYTIPGKGYMVNQQLTLTGLDAYVDRRDLQFNWVNSIRRLERELKESRAKTTVNYYTLAGNSDYLSKQTSGLEEETLEEPLKWVAFNQKFFTQAIIAESRFSGGRISSVVDENDTTTVKTASMVLTIPAEDLLAGNANFDYFYGPNNYQILKKVTDGFSSNVELGWFAIFNKYLVIPIFNWLENYITNYGIIIIILVFIIKIMLFPLSYKSYVSMAKTKALKPELDELKEKHGGDMQKMQSEQMQLYQKAGINPLSGCVPMLLQLPILLAMFNFFPNSIELRQKSFLWADDLSTYDSVFSWDAYIPLLSDFYGNHISLFTLLMTASTILYTWSNSQMTTVQGPMKTMQYVMPVMFLFFLNNYSSGLTFYYFVSNLVTFGQQAVIRKFVDESKIRKIIDDNKKKNANKKKSNFQMRLEEAMKAGDENRKKTPPKKK